MEKTMNFTKRLIAEIVIFIIPMTIGVLTAHYIDPILGVSLTWTITNILSHLNAKYNW